MLTTERELLFDEEVEGAVVEAEGVGFNGGTVGRGWGWWTPKCPPWTGPIGTIFNLNKSVFFKEILIHKFKFVLLFSKALYTRSSNGPRLWWTQLMGFLIQKKSFVNTFNWKNYQLHRICQMQFVATPKLKSITEFYVSHELFLICYLVRIILVRMAVWFKKWCQVRTYVFLFNASNFFML